MTCANVALIGAGVRARGGRSVRLACGDHILFLSLRRVSVCA